MKLNAHSGDIGVQKSKIEISKSKIFLSKYLNICVDTIACMTLAMLSGTLYLKTWFTFA